MTFYLREKYKKKTNRPIVLATLVISTFMSAIEGTIVAAAMPGIVSELGGFSLYSWVFSAYLIMQAVTILLYGKLADMFGRKPIFIFGIAVFLIGSLLCGFATSMIMLIVFRIIQGLGAGAITPIANTIVGDIYALNERGKVQGYLSSVWGISAIVGPLLGGIFVQYVGWSMIFWLNIPIGLAAIVGIGFFLHEEVDKKKEKIDYIGTFLFLISVLSLMLVFIQGGSAWEWQSLEIIGLSIVSLIFFLLFAFQQTHIENPMFPLSLWSQRFMVCANLATFTSGIIIIGVASFLPAFVQGVMGESPIVAGFTLTTMSIGWPIAATVAGTLIVNTGYRSLAIAGGLALLIGSLLFVFITPSIGPIWAATASFFVGMGMGLLSTTCIVVIQNAVCWNIRGFATANNMFMRMLGSAVGAAILGGILNSQMKRYFLNEGETIDESVLRNISSILLNESEHKHLSSRTLQLLQDGLVYGLHSVFLCLVVVALVTLIFIIWLPKNIKESRT